MSARRLLIAACALVLVWHGGYPTAQTPSSAAPYTVLSKEGRRPLAARTIGGQEMFALDDLARLFDLSVREDAAAGALNVAVRNQTIVLSTGQGLASVSGRLISLPAAPVREGRIWYVPVDFVSRALAPVLGTPLELRKPSRLVILGGYRMPRVAGRIEPLGSVARLTLDVAPATPHTVAQEGSRLLIRFEADALDAALPASTAPELIQNVRPDAGGVIAVDLGAKFGSFRASDVPGARGSGRIVIDIMAAEAQPVPGQPAPPTPPPPVAQDAPPLLELAPPGGIRTVVIDPGHGGDDAGARGAGGALEKEITLGVARRLDAALEARLGVRVLLTREDDRTLGLDQRAAFANNSKADLFISLHANASFRSAASGAQIFHLSLEDYGDRAQQIARGSNEALPVVGGGTRDIEVIPWELAQARYITESAALAQSIEAAFRDRVALSARAVQQAPLRVLVGANMPAVLVEMGFLTNPQQEQQLTSDAFQVSIVQALVDAVVAVRDRGLPR